MSKCRTLFSLVLLLSYGILHSQTKGSDTLAIIPFTLNQASNIVVETVLNDRDTLRLMFHTASSGITLTKNATTTIKSLQWEQTSEVTSWGGKSESRYSKSNKLSIGEWVVDSLELWENINSGPDTDGKFGPDLFQNKAVEVNYDLGKILVYEEISTPVPFATIIPIKRQGDLLFIEGKSVINGKEIVHPFLLHSGYGGALLFDDDFVSQNKLDQYIKITDTQTLKDSYNNTIEVKKGILPRFDVGEVNMENVPLGFFMGSISNQKMSVIGADVMKRINFILDDTRDHLYVWPSHYLSESF